MHQISLKSLASTEPIRFVLPRVQALVEDQKRIHLLLKTLTRYGCVVLDLTQITSPQQELMSLTQILGEPLNHSDAMAAGLTEITPRSERNDFAALTTRQNLPHTDGSYIPTPPPVIALQCEVPAELGGDTVIIPAEDLHQYLAQVDPEGLAALYAADAVTIQRKDQIHTYPIFEQIEGRRVRVAFKPDEDEPSFSTQPHPRLGDTIQRMQRFLSDPEHQFRFKLQSGQILLIDNLRMFHGRTAIESATQIPPRKLNRLWFDGQSPYQDQWELGFYPELQPALITAA